MTAHDLIKAGMALDAQPASAPAPYIEAIAPQGPPAGQSTPRPAGSPASLTKEAWGAAARGGAKLMGRALGSGAKATAKSAPGTIARSASPYTAARAASSAAAKQAPKAFRGGAGSAYGGGIAGERIAGRNIVERAAATAKPVPSAFRGAGGAVRGAGKKAPWSPAQAKPAPARPAAQPAAKPPTQMDDIQNTMKQMLARTPKPKSLGRRAAETTAIGAPTMAAGAGIYAIPQAYGLGGMNDPGAPGKWEDVSPEHRNAIDWLIESDKHGQQYGNWNKAKRQAMQNTYHRASMEEGELKGKLQAMLRNDNGDYNTAMINKLIGHGQVGDRPQISPGMFTGEDMLAMGYKPFAEAQGNVRMRNAADAIARRQYAASLSPEDRANVQALDDAGLPVEDARHGGGRYKEYLNTLGKMVAMKDAVGEDMNAYQHRAAMTPETMQQLTGDQYGALDAIRQGKGQWTPEAAQAYKDAMYQWELMNRLGYAGGQ